MQWQTNETPEVRTMELEPICIAHKSEIAAQIVEDHNREDKHAKALRSSASMILHHTLPPCVLRDLLGSAKMRTVTLMAALLIGLLAAIGLTLYYADAIDNWRP